MFLLYILIGFVVACIAALPPGAANIAVVNTTANKTLNQALYIIVGAGIGEVLLSLFALHCTMNLTSYFENNPWLQITVFILFIVVGAYFLLQKHLDLKLFKIPAEKRAFPKWLKGFLLAILNPPVLIFWVLAFTIIHKHVIKVSEMSPLFTLVIFFTGIFLGKTATLYGYGLWRKKLDKGTKNSTQKTNTVIGIALILVGVIQGIRFFIGSP